MYLGPGGGTLPALSSSIMSSTSFGVRSSWKQQSKTNEKKSSIVHRIIKKDRDDYSLVLNVIDSINLNNLIFNNIISNFESHFKKNLSG